MRILGLPPLADTPHGFILDALVSVGAWHGLGKPKSCPSCAGELTLRVDAAGYCEAVSCTGGCDQAKILEPLAGYLSERFQQLSRDSQKATEAVKPTSGVSLLSLALPLTPELLRAQPPSRRYLVYDSEGRGVLPRGVVGMLGAPGGTGKTKAIVGLAVSVATGGLWFGAWQCERGRVLLVLAEESQEETLRRLHFALRNASDDELMDVANNLTVLPAAGVGLALTHVTDGRLGGLPETPRADELRALLRDAEACGRPYDLLVLDPSSRFGGPDSERDNAAATRYVQVLETFTTRECGQPNVILPAHTRKRSRDDEPGSTDTLRGASGLRDAARWVAMLEPRKVVDEGPELLDLVLGKTNQTKRNALVLVKEDAFEGTLRAATENEIAAFKAAIGKQPERHATAAQFKKLESRILEEISTEPASDRTLSDRLRVHRRHIAPITTALFGSGRITRRGGKNGAWEVVPGVSQAVPTRQGGTWPSGTNVVPVDHGGTWPGGSPLKGGNLNHRTPPQLSTSGPPGTNQSNDETKVTS